MKNLETILASITFKNPIWVASGTFGDGQTFEDFIDLDTIGALTTKTVTLQERAGNPPPRLCETASGLLNSIGLQNKGAAIFKQEHYSRLQTLKTSVIISIAGMNASEWKDCIEILEETDFPTAFELNLSCPNVSHGQSKTALIAQDAQLTEKITKSIKSITHRPIFVKLTPNVTDIGTIAQAAEQGGADAIVLVNTYLGMAVDAETMQPLLGNIVGGLSGPAIKPLALRAVWEVYHKVSIPLIGVGGISSGTDIIEFMLCGAQAVQIGTAHLVDPDRYPKILNEFQDYLERKNINHWNQLVGQLQFMQNK